MGVQVVKNSKIQEIIKKFEEKNIKVDILEEIESERLSHYWYGGDVVRLTINDDMTLTIVANGDVYATYYENGEESIYVKDKNNAGSFYWEMGSVIKNDEQLYELMNSDGDTRLEIDYNNWWELFADCRGNFIDMMYDLDSSSLDEAMEEVYESLDEVLEYLKPFVEKAKEEEAWIKEHVQGYIYTVVEIY